MTYIQQSKERRRKGVENVVDLEVQVVRAVQRSPALEDGVRHLEHTVVDLRVVGREARDQVCHQGVPSLPEVRVGDQADSFTQLCLDGRGTGDHEADQLLLDGDDLILGQQVLAVAVDIAEADEVFEVQSRGETGLER